MTKTEFQKYVRESLTQPSLNFDYEGGMLYRISMSRTKEGAGFRYTPIHSIQIKFEGESCSESCRASIKANREKANKIFAKYQKWLDETCKEPECQQKWEAHEKSRESHRAKE